MRKGCLFLASFFTIFIVIESHLIFAFPMIATFPSNSLLTPLGPIFLPFSIVLPLYYFPTFLLFYLSNFLPPTSSTFLLLYVPTFLLVHSYICTLILSYTCIFPNCRPIFFFFPSQFLNNLPIIDGILRDKNAFTFMVSVLLLLIKHPVKLFLPLPPSPLQDAFPQLLNIKHFKSYGLDIVYVCCCLICKFKLCLTTHIITIDRNLQTGPGGFNATS